MWRTYIYWSTFDQPGTPWEISNSNPSNKMKVHTSHAYIPLALLATTNSAIAARCNPQTASHKQIHLADCHTYKTQLQSNYANNPSTPIPHDGLQKISIGQSPCSIGVYSKDQQPGTFSIMDAVNAALNVLQDCEVEGYGGLGPLNSDILPKWVVEVPYSP